MPRQPITHFERNLALALILIGAAMRLVPHPANFSPVMAVALFSGAVLPASLALTVPLLLMVVSDLILGPHPLFWLTWGSFAAVVLIGMRLGSRAGWKRILGGALAGSVFFFITTNLGVFLFTGLYPKTTAGLWQCFILAIPFFRNSLAGDMTYTAALFGVFQLVRSHSVAKSPSSA